MSRLSELIAELCPDGVEYRALGEVASFGGGHTPAKADASNYEEGGICWVTSKDVKTDMLSTTGITLSERGASSLTIYPAGTLVMVTRSGVLKRMLPVAFLSMPMTVNQDIKAILPNDELILPKYLFHILKASDAEIRERYGKVGGTVDSVNFNMVKKHRIPVPPIEVQREVVRILDEYTAAHDELISNLKAEIRLREQQLSIARNELLTFRERERVRWATLGEICRVGRGTYITGKEVVPGSIPVILGGMVPAYYHNASNHEGEAIVVSRSGVNAGYASFWNEPIFVSDGFVVDSPAEVVSLQYVFEVMKSRQQEMIGMNRGSGVPHITGKMLSSLRIPLPNIEAQGKLVDTLGNLSKCFEEFYAELELERDSRDVELALVRNQLLSFPEKKAV